MLKVLLTRWQQGFRTMAWPDGAAVVPDRFRGLPALDGSRCGDCRICFDHCPTGAITRDGEGSVASAPSLRQRPTTPSMTGESIGSVPSLAGGSVGSAPSLAGGLVIDLGTCLFCGECERVCPSGAVRFTTDFRLAVRKREDLLFRGGDLSLASPLEDSRRSLFADSCKFRQVSAAGCNACEADFNVLGTPAFDLGRFGLQVVASPRHADALLLTGPVSQNMHLALEKTYQAMPSPKLVIAQGACAISGGLFAGHPEVNHDARSTLPVDLFIPGCPPHPLTILDGLLRLLGRI